MISHLLYFMLNTKFCYGPSLCFPKMWRRMRGCESFKTIWLRILCSLFYHLPTTRELSFSICCFFSFFCVFFLSPLWQNDYVMKYCKFTAYDLCKIFIQFLSYLSCFLSFLINYSLFSHLVTSTLNQCEIMNVWKTSWNKRSQVASPIYYQPTFDLPYLSYFLFFTFHQSWLGFCFSLHL